jgi:hypothetical protein
VAALTAVRLTPQLGNPSSVTIAKLKLPMKASTKIYAGSLVCIDAGYAAPARTATGLVVVGRAESTVDNSAGAAGDKVIEVCRGTFKWANSSAGDLIAQADVGKLVYAVDDQTVAKTDGTGARTAAGVAWQIDSDGVWVEHLGNPYLAT